jgi:hypothetical protein
MLRLVSSRTAPGEEAGQQAAEAAGSGAVAATRSRRFTLRWGRVAPSGWRVVYARNMHTGRLRRLKVLCTDRDGPRGPSGDDPPPSATAARHPADHAYDADASPLPRRTAA